MDKETVNYAKNYCEENCWYLCQHSALAGKETRVLIISNQAGNCSFWEQQSTSESAPVCWDYHVVVLAKVNGEWCVYDFDSNLEFPVSLGRYLACTFKPEWNATVNAPVFKVFTGNEFTRTFSSDRSHMKDAAGNWIFQPPAWDAIESDQSPRLSMVEIRDFSSTSPHRLFSLEEVRDKFLHT